MPLIPGGGRKRRRDTVEVVAKTVLSPSDFTYLGVVRVPTDVSPGSPTGIRFGYSLGTTISHRYVNGDLKLLLGMSQAGTMSEPKGNLCELNYDSTVPGILPSTSPRLSVYRNWGDIYQGRSVQETTGYHQFGFLWDDEDEKLLWSYGPRYSGIHERSIGATELHANFTMTKHGTWRTSCHSKQSNGYMLKIPTEYRTQLGGSDVLIGGINTSINAQSTFGFSLHSFDSSNTLGRPADNYTDTNSVSIDTSQLMMSGSSNRMNRDPTYIPCSKGPPPYNCTSPTLGVPTSYVSDIDIGNGCAWVEGASKHGLVFIGVMVDSVNSQWYRDTHYNGDELPHTWYATAGSPCCHGHTAMIEGTGPHTPSLVPQMWIYDPDLLVQVQSGIITPLQALNSPTHKQKHLYDYSWNFPVHKDYYECGCTYDSVSGLFFVNTAKADYASQHEGINYIHVFQVAS
jgi:hypothetical protein